jgi:hypothetical protein
MRILIKVIFKLTKHKIYLMGKSNIKSKFQYLVGEKTECLAKYLNQLVKK